MTKLASAIVCAGIIGAIVWAGVAYWHKHDQPGTLSPKYKEKAELAVHRISFFVMEGGTGEGAGIDDAESAVAEASKSRGSRQDDLLQADLQRDAEAARRLVKIRLRIGMLSDQMALTADRSDSTEWQNLQGQVDEQHALLPQTQSVVSACMRLVEFRLGNYPALESSDQKMCSSVDDPELP